MRSNRNSVRCLEIDGKRCEDPSIISGHITSFYKNLYNCRKSLGMKWKEVWDLPTLKEEDVKGFSTWVTVDKVERASFSIKLDKAPGPDGFDSFFFRENWEILNLDVTKAMLSFFSSGKMLKEMNKMFVMVVPNRENTK